jgi:hypothetical protein
MIVRKPNDSNPHRRSRKDRRNPQQENPGESRQNSERKARKHPKSSSENRQPRP